MNVSRDLISKVTDAVMDDVRAWQSRPLDDVYPVVFLDAFILKIRENGSVQRKACYLALGVRLDGQRDVLGMWFQDTEGAKFWMHVLGDLKRRGVRDILICCVDGLTGFPEAIEAIFPQTTVQTCVVHLIRRSLRYVPRRELEKVAKDLKPIYTAGDQDAAWQALEAFDQKWGERFPPVVQAWQDAWEHFTPFLRVRRRGPPRHLHDQRDRSAEPAATQSDQDQRPLPLRGRRPQADLPRDPERDPAMDPHPGVDQGAARVQDRVRRPAPGRKLTPTPRQPSTTTLDFSQPTAHTVFLTPSPGAGDRTRFVVDVVGRREGALRIRAR